MKAVEMGITAEVANREVENAHIAVDFAKRLLKQTQEILKLELKMLPQFRKQAKESEDKIVKEKEMVERLTKAVEDTREYAGLTKEGMAELKNPRLDDAEREMAISKLSGVKIDPAAIRASREGRRDSTASLTGVVKMMKGELNSSMEANTSRWNLYEKQESLRDLFKVESHDLRTGIEKQLFEEMYEGSVLGAKATAARGKHRPQWVHSDFFSMSDADLKIEAMRRAMRDAEIKVEKQRKILLARRDRRSSYSIANQALRRASWSLAPEKEKHRRSSIGLPGPGDPAAELARWQQIQQKKAEKEMVKSGKVDWGDIRTPLQCPYHSVRKVEPYYALPLLPHLVNAPPCLAPTPSAYKDSFTRSIKGGSRTMPQGGNRSQSADVLRSELKEYSDFYGDSVMMGVEKHLVTDWSGGGFSPRFLHDQNRSRSMLTSGSTHGRNIHI